MEWGSFVFGLFVGAIIFGALGILIGGLVQIAVRTERRSDFSGLVHEAGMMLPKGELISFTIGHDVCLPEGPEEGGEQSEKYWERN